MDDSSEIPNPDPHLDPASGSDGPPTVCVIVSRYNGSVTRRLRDGAERAYRGRFGEGGRLVFIDAPGTFELAALSAAACDTGIYDGVVALGCVIRGETDHDRYISQAVASALAALPAQMGVPVAFGVITANTTEQAETRSGGTGGMGNKGVEAMDALLDTIEAVDHLLATAERGEPTSFALDRISADKAGAGAETR